MAYLTTDDGAEIYFKDWGDRRSQPIVFHHGWPLSSDDWDTQMLYFLGNGFRLVATDRRGHGRSSQISTGHDMDHYASDVNAVVKHLDLRNAIHIGHSTGGGQVARYVAQYGEPQQRVAKAVLASAVPSLMVQTESNPDGTPRSVFDGFRQALAANRAEFYEAVASGPFYGFNRDGVTPSRPVIDNWWRQGMNGSALAHYGRIRAFSETDQTDDLRAITVPVFVIQGDDDTRSCGIRTRAVKQAELLSDATLKVYEGFPHGMLTTHADVISPDTLAFIRQYAVTPSRPGVEASTAKRPIGHTHVCPIGRLIGGSNWALREQTTTDSEARLRMESRGSRRGQVRGRCG